MSELEIRHTNVFTRNLEGYMDKNYRIIFNQGGTRSSKTVSIAQLFIYLMVAVLKNSVITVVRKSLTSLRASAMKDFFEHLKLLGLYNEEDHNKSDHIYKLGTSEIEFVGLDQPQKKRGTKRKILWCNEANELTLEDWTQLILRTEGKIFIDLNPSEEFHWLWDKVLTRPDCLFIQSTYKDNPFLPTAMIEEIERLKEQDENYWRVYGLGERGVSQNVIYTNWKTFDKYPAKVDEVYYGLDFGFNNPSSLVKVSVSDDVPYCEELIYQSRLTNSDLIAELQRLEIGESDYIYCDCAEPARIQEISEAGFNATEADKSVKDGLDYCKRKQIRVHNESANAIKELRSYKYKIHKNGHVLDEPIKFNDHFCDAMRYALYTHSLHSDMKMFFVK